MIEHSPENHAYVRCHNVRRRCGSRAAPRPPAQGGDGSSVDFDIDGEVWDPRKKLAAELGVCDTTLKRWNFRTAYIGGVAYIPREECLREIAGRARRRNEPALRRGRPKKEALV